MKKLILFLSAILGSSAAFAQYTVLEGKVVEDWIIMAHDAQLKARCTTQEILHPQDPQKFPPGMLDTLIAYDWVKVSNYHYKDNTFSNLTGINKVSNQTFLLHFFEDGSSREYYALDKFYDTPAGVEPIPLKGHDTPPVTVGEKYGYTWLFFDEAKTDGLRLVSYRNGLLIIDTTDGGEKPGQVEYARRFRDAYIKVPRMLPLVPVK